jgi:hypothetical protein
MAEEITAQPSPVVTSQAPVSRVTGAEVAAPYQALGRALDKVSGGLEEVAKPLAEYAGSSAVTTDDQGNMTVARFPIFGAAGAAYDRALKFSALAQADADAKRKDIEISRQYANDPNGYLKAATEYRDGVVDHMTKIAGPDVGFHVKNAIDTTTTYNYRRLWSEQQATIKRNFDKDTQWAIDSKTEQLLSLCRNGGCDTKQADTLVQEIHSVFSERTNNAVLAAPQSEHDRATVDLGRNMQAAVFEHKISTTLQSGAAPYKQTIETAGAKYGIDPTLLARQIYQESGFRESAISPVGAEGISQFMPETARRYGVDVRSPESSIEGQARYMADLSRQFGGNTGLMLAGYNWGEGNVAKWMASGANPNTMPRETRNYIQAITGQPIEAWLRGERPNPLAMEAPRFAGGTDRALSMIDVMRNDPKVDPVQRQLNVERGLAAVKDYHDNVARAINLAELGQKQRDEAAENALIVDSAKEQPTITENQIKTAPDVSPAAKARMLRFQKQEDMPEPLARVSHDNSVEAFKRMQLPAGDPNRISTVGQISELYGQGKLTRADFDWLTKTLADTRDPQGERLAEARKEFTKATGQVINKSTPLGGFIDPDGGLRVYAFERMVDAKIAEYKAAGKSPFDLLDPTKPDFLGKPEILHAAGSPWAPPPLDQAAAAAADRLSRSVTAPPTGSTIPAPPPIVAPTQAAPAILQRQPGESLTDYDKRAGIR